MAIAENWIYYSIEMILIL